MAVRRSSTTVLFLAVLYSSAAESKLEYDESPTLLELQRFPVKDQFEDIVAEIQNDYEHFGIRLLEDSNGVKIKGIEKSKLGDPVDITVEILRHWLQGKGRTPVTWRTFVECLRESGLNVPANHIEASLLGGSNVPGTIGSSQRHFSIFGILVAIVIGILMIVVTVVIVKREYFNGMPPQDKDDIPTNSIGATQDTVGFDYPEGKRPSKAKKPDKTGTYLSHPDKLKKVKLTFKNVDIVRGQKLRGINDIYPMEHSRHGTCVIVSNKKFTDHLDRPGTEKDEQNLFVTFQYLGYDVELYQNCKAREIEGIFEKLYLRDFSNDDSLVCCILSHGEEGRVFGSDSRAIELDRITSLFTGRKCPQLKHKPKLFFIQACRGKAPTEVIAKDDHGVQPDDGRIPEQAHFFFGYATPPGYKALRDTSLGSWYISELCEVFCTYATFSSLQDMHTKVVDNVCEKESDFGTKEAPEDQNRLRRTLYFL